MTVKKNKICVGVIADAHGVRGLVKVRSFTEEPCDILAYGTLYDEAFSREFVLEKLSVNKDVILAKLVGVADRDKALELKGVKLFVERDKLPKLEEETFYHSDLIGLEVFSKEGRSFGKITAVHNFGAGDVLDVKTPNGASVMVAFTKKNVPTVDIENQKVLVACDDWFEEKKEDKNAKS